MKGIEVPGTGVQIAHPFNKGFERVHVCKSDEEIDLVFQGDLKFQVTGDQQIAAEAAEAATTNGESEQNGAPSDAKPKTIWTTTYYIGLELDAQRKCYSLI